MRSAMVLAALVAVVAPVAHETRVPVDNADLYARDIGTGPPMIVLHGGPDFDHRYLLPDLDRLSDAYRLIYYDQRGRGLSADGVKPDDVTMASEMADLDAVRAHFQLDTTTLVGHSWGTVLALEYAIRHSDRVSRLILMNPAPASAEDYHAFRKAYAEKLSADLDRMRAIQATPAYVEGDPDAVAARYRIHFKFALARPSDLVKIMIAMRASFTKEGVVKARAVEDRLMEETWSAAGYDLLPKLASVHVPTLVVYGDHDFIPVETAAHITRALPDARMVTLKKCGHFSYLECSGALRRAVDAFFRSSQGDRSGS
jgi:proline iminopeptidase